MKNKGFKRMLTCLLAAAMVVVYCPFALADSSDLPSGNGNGDISTTTPPAVTTTTPQALEIGSAEAGSSSTNGSFTVAKVGTPDLSKEITFAFDFLSPDNTKMGGSVGYFIFSAASDTSFSWPIVQKGDKVSVLNKFGGSEVGVVTESFTANVWHHFVYRFIPDSTAAGGKRVEVYLDGEKKVSYQMGASDPKNLTGGIAGSGQVSFGNTNGHGFYDNVCISYDGELALRETFDGKEKADLQANGFAIAGLGDTVEGQNTSATMSSVTVSLKGNPELKNNKAYKVSDIFNVAGELSDGTAAAGELIALSPVSDEDAAIVGGEITFKKTGTFDLGLKAAYFGLEADATVSVTVAQGTEQVLEVVNYDSSVDATKNSFWGRYQDGILTGQEYYYAFDYKYDDASAMQDFMVYSELVTTYEWVIKQTGTKLTITEQADTPITLTENLSADTWHHFVIHYTATTVGVYIDGQLQNNGQYFTRTKRPNYKYEMLGWNGRVGTAMTGHAYYDNLVLIDGGTKTTYSMPWDDTTIDEIKAGDTNNKWVFSGVVLSTADNVDAVTSMTLNMSKKSMSVETNKFYSIDEIFDVSGTLNNGNAVLPKLADYALGEGAPESVVMKDGRIRFMATGTVTIPFKVSYMGVTKDVSVEVANVAEGEPIPESLAVSAKGTIEQEKEYNLDDALKVVVTMSDGTTRDMSASTQSAVTVTNTAAATLNNTTHKITFHWKTVPVSVSCQLGEDTVQTSANIVTADHADGYSLQVGTADSTFGYVFKDLRNGAQGKWYDYTGNVGDATWKVVPNTEDWAISLDYKYLSSETDNMNGFAIFKSKKYGNGVNGDGPEKEQYPQLFQTGGELVIKTSAEDAGTKVALTADVWHNLVIRGKGTKATVYLDGKVALPEYDRGSNWPIGGGDMGDVTAADHNGYGFFDNLKIYSNGEEIKVDQRDGVRYIGDNFSFPSNDPLYLKWANASNPTSLGVQINYAGASAPYRWNGSSPAYGAFPVMFSAGGNSMKPAELGTVTAAVKGEASITTGTAYNISDIFDITAKMNNNNAAIMDMATISATAAEDVATVANGKITFLKSGNVKVSVTLFGKTVESADVSVTAQAPQPGTYTLTVVSADTSMGTVTGGGSFAAGTTPAISATPKQGYHFTGWSSTEAGIIADASAASTTVTMPAKVVTVTASFAADTPQPTTYSVSATVTGGIGGTASVDKSSVTEGGSATLTVTPDNGYIVESVSMNGAPVVLTNNQYTASNIQANVAFVVTFKSTVTPAEKFNVTTSVISGSGTITPLGTTEVGKGGSFTFTVAPKSGYRVSMVEVNGNTVSLDNNGQYTISNVDKNYVVKVSFQRTSSGSSSSNTTHSGSSGSYTAPPSAVETEDVVSNIKEATNGESVVVQTTKPVVVDADILKTLKEDGKSASFEVVDDLGEMIYSWEYDGKDITNPSIAASAGLTVSSLANATNEDLKDAASDIDSALVLSFDHTGTLPGKAKITINVAGKYTDGAQLYFYYFNESTKKLELIAKDIVVVDGKAVIPLTHCSEYILTDTPIAGATVAPSTPSTSKPAPSTPSTGSAANPQTGDSNPIGLLSLMVAMLAASLVVFKKKVIDVK